MEVKLSLHWYSITN